MEELWLVLKPSKIEGVGVFTERKIVSGEYLRMWLTTDWLLSRCPKGRVKKMCDRFGVLHANGYYSRPKSFVRMSIAWYLNHSTRPNVQIDKRGRCYAHRNIKVGEELTIDYSCLDTDIDNQGHFP